VSRVPAGGGENCVDCVWILSDLLTLSLFPFVSCRWLWPRIVSTSWTPLYCDPAALIERSNSRHQTRRLASTFSKFTRERWIWLVASTYERLPSSCPALPERKSRFISFFFSTLWLVFSSLLTFHTYIILVACVQQILLWVVGHMIA
jgi:hypothetical protein